MKINYRPPNSKRTEERSMRPVSLESQNKDGKRTILVTDESAVRTAQYNDERKQWEVNANKKAVFSLLLLCLLFTACKKDEQLITPSYDYSAKITAPMNEKTILFQIYARPDTTGLIWAYVATKTKYEVEHDNMGFNISYFYCNGKRYPGSGTLIGAVREKYWATKDSIGDRPLDSTNVIIIKNPK